MRVRNLSLLLVGALWLMAPKLTFACEHCFGAAVDTPTTRGIGLAMLALLCMTISVGAGIMAFFVNVNHRTQLLEPGAYVVNDDGEIEARDTAE